MFLNMIDQKPETRAFLAAIRGLPIKAQERMCADAGIPVGKTFKSGEGGRDVNIRDRWIRGLREHDTAWVPDLRVLVLPKSALGGDQPGADFAGALAELCRRRAVIVDARHKLKSTDADWPNHVKWVMRQLPAIHRSQAGMRRAARAAQAMRDQGLTTIWRSKPEAEFNAARALWRDPELNEMQAIAQLPDDLRVVSPATVRRIFGPRRVGKKSAGGRPRKQPR